MGEGIGALEGILGPFERMDILFIVRTAEADVGVAVGKAF